jgi:N-acyl-D-amino-acid deacylase
MLLPISRLIQRSSGALRVLLLTIPVWLATGPAQAQTSQLFRSATVIDGSGHAAYTADVRIAGGRVLALGQLEPLLGEATIDARGLVLAPGFIDTHSHHDESLFESPEAVEAVSQGITTIIVGADGGSSAPMAEFRQRIAESRPALNVASYTGHGTIREAVMGKDYQRAATQEEVDAMKRLLRADLEAGSLGLSTGLEYDPGIYSDPSEVIALARVLRDFDARYSSHMRSEDRAFFEALEELLTIGREAQVPVHVSHLKLAAVDIWGRAGEVLKRLDHARAEGIDVTADIYPYTYWESTLTVLLPERDFYDLDAANYALEHLAPADGLTLSRYDPDPSLVGKTVQDVAKERQQGNAETYLELIRAAYPDDAGDDSSAATDYAESVIGVSMSEDDIATFVAWEHANVCSDGAATGHPRGRGAFPRAIRRYVIDDERISLESMIHKMTGLSARHAGIEGRGLIRPGFAADLVLFDPALIRDTATIDEPDGLSLGIIGVWVNGQRVWQNQEASGARPGQFVAGRSTAVTTN